MADHWKRMTQLGEQENFEECGVARDQLTGFQSSRFRSRSQPRDGRRSWGHTPSTGCRGWTWRNRRYSSSSSRSRSRSLWPMPRHPSRSLANMHEHDAEEEEAAENKGAFAIRPGLQLKKKQQRMKAPLPLVPIFFSWRKLALVARIVDLSCLTSGGSTSTLTGLGVQLLSSSIHVLFQALHPQASCEMISSFDTVPPMLFM